MVNFTDIANNSSIKGELKENRIFFFHICDPTSINSYFVHNISLEFLGIAEKYYTIAESIFVKT